jgi:hypothetical protein
VTFDLALSHHIYYVQLDSAGVILDRNQAFINAFNHIDPYSIDQIIHPQDCRLVKVVGERLKRCEENCCYIIEIRTLNHEKQWVWGYYEVQRINECFVVAGMEYMVSHQDGVGKIKQYRRLFSETQFSLNHLIRKEVANVEGLVLMNQFHDPYVIRLIVLSIGQLNQYLKTLVNRIDRFNK